ncbi:hypothetical protein [Salinarimonas soli]|uniref:Uncharacterized protein n=1 Tax=Salinarimonas soli TaxID=1638099 RepID=A0A5B2VH09_9HYPH|nr:hypothetical protein [Salinarimonas soli]KAA2237908.1 hypothetical protein F0L46_07905 [Salinarimonas soli]
MTGLILAPARLPLPGVPAELLRRDPALARAGLLLLALMVPTAIALAVDPRTLNGVAIWVKPLKFEASIGVYLLTLAWFMGELPEAVRRGRVAGALRAVAIGAASFEMVYIAAQAARGLASHYNVGDPFHAAMYGLMGVGAVALTAVSPALAVLLARHRPAHLAPAYLTSIVLGLTLTFVLGAGSGAVLSAGNGHWIGGIRSDAGGLPVLGWSRTGGDLRSAHFLGMHALHALPVVGYAAGRLLAPRAGLAAVLAAALAYSSATIAAFVLALRGVPLIGG